VGELMKKEVKRNFKKRKTSNYLKNQKHRKQKNRITEFIKEA
jgi:hypothetical protein